MTCIIKPCFTILIVLLSTIGLNASDSIPDYLLDSSYVDTTMSVEQELQTYLYHLNVVVEFQNYQIARQQLIIMILSGILILFITIIIIRWLSRRFERSIRLFKVKKHEQAPASTLKSIFNFWKVKDSLKSIQQKLLLDEGETVSFDKMLEVASAYGMEVHVLKGTINDLLSCLTYPVIAIFHNHISIVYKTKKDKLFIADSFYGHLHLTPYYFANNWFTDAKNENGVFVAMIPGKERGRKVEKYRIKLAEMENVDKRVIKQLRIH